MWRWFLAALALLALSPPAAADVVFATAPDLNLAIADDIYNGTLASMSCANIPVTGGMVEGLAVRASIDHTWLGDLTVKVVSPGNTTITLMSLPGIAEVADNGTSVTGDNSNLVASDPIDFVDGGAKSAENMGNTITGTQAACRDDAACVYDPSAGAAIAGKLAAFIGVPMAGTWRFCVGDSGVGDVGQIQQVRLTFVSEEIVDGVFANGFE